MESRFVYEFRTAEGEILRIRHTAPEDIPVMSEVYKIAKNFMMSTGNIHQWVADYPFDHMLVKDCERGVGYVVETEEAEICGTFAYILGEDATYKVIEEGNWLNDEPYGTLHRVASSGAKKGIVDAAMAFALSVCRNLRIDTHYDNHVMQHKLTKMGFTFCGRITIDDGSPRKAYQIINENFGKEKAVAEIMREMIDFSEGNKHNVAHFVKVHSYARTIGLLEGLEAEVQKTLEIAAIVHDIAIPLCMEKYGNCRGPLQEKEGIHLVYSFLGKMGLSKECLDRIAFLVGHHHNLLEINGIDYQILIEADYLVNADESEMSRENIVNMRDMYFKTASGIHLLNSIYAL